MPDGKVGGRRGCRKPALRATRAEFHLVANRGHWFPAPRCEYCRGVRVQMD